jgi:transglutaminase-like putative cysteine protease
MVPTPRRSGLARDATVAIAAKAAPTSLAPLLWLLIPLLLVLAPHTLRLPLWITLAWLVFALLSLYGAQARRQPVGRVLKIVLALAGIAGVLLKYGTVIGPTGGVALLAYLTGVKLLETNTPRDRLGLLFVGCFLLVAHFLDGQSMITAAYMAFAALALVAGMIATQLPASALAPSALHAWRPTLALAARLMAQALPLALLIFLLFPRMQGPLWGLPQQVAAQTGLSDHMSPGDISRLILSDELAFRAEFSGAQPTPQQLYWRGPVFWDYDGRTWRTATALPGAAPEATGFGSLVRYSLTLEPHRQRWLPLLGLPARLPELPGNPTRLGADLQWQSKEPINQRLRYEVEAYPDYHLEPDLSPDLRARALALPGDLNPRARELARGWLEGAANDDAIVNRALALFRTQPFFYTLKPPRLGESAVDDFLFATRRGFCEHYASSFVFLMRAAGLPARVVTGYQGGEHNPLGNYLIVRGRDAHAWAEVWQAGRGWVRVDPTAAVAPSRVERGIDAALPAAERPGGLITLEGAWLRPLRLGWDLLNNQWNQWVLGYNQERQREFLARLNPLLANWQGMVWALGVGAALLVLAVAVALWPRLAVTRRDPASREYQRFCRALARHGIPRGAAEAPEEYARRAVARRPDLGIKIRHITRLYLACRYGTEGNEALRDLRAAVRTFRPGR